MNNEMPPAPPSTDTGFAIIPDDTFERAEAAATRRRWITLAEFVAVVGLVIAGLGLWMSWADRRADLADKQQEKTTENNARTLLTLDGEVASDGETIALSDANHELFNVDVIFPSMLEIAPQNSMLGQQIHTRWFADKLLALTDDGPDKRMGRLPVMLKTTYWDRDQQRTTSAIYDVVWQTEGRVLRGRKLRMKAIKLSDRNGTQARLDAAWAREKPKS